MKKNMNIRKNILLIVAVIVFMVPVLSFAQGEEYGGGNGGGNGSGPSFNISCGLTNLNSIVTCVSGIMQASVWFLMSAAFIYTIYGAVRFIGAEGSDREKWRSVMVYGIIGLFVISSIWGLVSLLDGTFNLSKTPIAPPQFVAP